MDKAYYKEYFEIERKHWWFRVREKIILSQIERFAGKSRDLKILNIGAATGRTTEALSQFGSVESLEYDQDCCDFVRQQTGMEFTNASITELPYQSESFDLVCAFDVIEHVEEDKKGVQEMTRVCRKGGLLFITVPAFMSLWSHHDVINHHHRRYTYTTLHKLFDGEHLNKVFASYFNSFLFLPIWGFRSLSNALPKNWIRKETGSDFRLKSQSSYSDKAFEKIFNLEVGLLKKRTLPVGVSLITVQRKKTVRKNARSNLNGKKPQSSENQLFN